MEKIQVVVAHHDEEIAFTVRRLIEKVAKQGKCKINVVLRPSPATVSPVVGIYATKTSQRTRLHEMLFRCLGMVSGNSVMLALNPSETKPSTLAKMKAQPKYVLHCDDKLPSHFREGYVGVAEVRLGDVPVASEFLFGDPGEEPSGIVVGRVAAMLTIGIMLTAVAVGAGVYFLQ